LRSVLVDRGFPDIEPRGYVVERGSFLDRFFDFLTLGMSTYQTWALRH